MCGRYMLEDPAAALAELGLEWSGDAAPHFNIAPTQNVPAVWVENAEPVAGARRWGLIPRWAKAAEVPGIGSRMINARRESAFDKPAFREAIRTRRCVLPADAFYEWHKIDGSKHKQAYLIHRADRRGLFLAGLFDTWAARDGSARYDTCCILTTAADQVIAPLHDRMPVILDRADVAAWIDPRLEIARVEALVAQAGPPMATTPVSSWVNDPKHDDRRCMEPVTISAALPAEPAAGARQLRLL